MQSFDLICNTSPILKTFEPRVLVIEDDPYWQAIFSYSLKQCQKKNFQLRFVRSAKQALDAIYAEPNFSLIISDHLLDGGTTGLDLWKSYRDQFRNIPFILISAKRRAELLKAESYIKAPLILEKPFELKNFKATVEIYLK